MKVILDKECKWSIRDRRTGGDGVRQVYQIIFIINKSSIKYYTGYVSQTYCIYKTPGTTIYNNI